MNGYVIKKGARYVAPAGSARSYTTRLERARIFATREAAEAERCPENERIETVAEQFGGRR